MQNKPKVAWSYSALSMFEQCPFKYAQIKIKKTVKDEFGEAGDWGQYVHKKLADAIALGSRLPDDLKRFQPVVDKLRAVPGEHLIERKIALREDLTPTEWFGKDVWVRAIVDFAAVNGDTAIVVDHKTGKRKPDEDQLKLFAAVMFSIYPELQRVRSAYLWLKENASDKFEYTRDQDLWSDFRRRVATIEDCIENDRWVKRPSGLCRNYCPVPKNLCEFSGRT